MTFSDTELTVVEPFQTGEVNVKATKHDHLYSLSPDIVIPVGILAALAGLPLRKA